MKASARYRADAWREWPPSLWGTRDRLEVERERTQAAVEERTGAALGDERSLVAVPSTLGATFSDEDGEPVLARSGPADLRGRSPCTAATSCGYAAAPSAWRR